MNTHKHYYAAHSYMGLNYTYDSPCWIVYAFDTKQERDRWVNENEYSQDTGNYVAMSVDVDTARKIAPDLRRFIPFDDAMRVKHLWYADTGWVEITHTY